MKFHRTILSKDELNKILNGGTLSKRICGIQVAFKLGNDKQQKIKDEIARLKALLKDTPKTKRRKRRSVNCPDCGKATRGLKLHRFLTHQLVTA